MAGKYIFDGSTNAYFTTGWNIQADPTEYTLVWKGKWNSSPAGYSNIIGAGGGVLGEVAISAGNALYYKWAGVSETSWTNDGVEHTFVMTAKEGEASAFFYIDGVLESSPAITDLILGPSSTLFIGALSAAQQKLEGELTHLYMYDKVFTAQEVADITADITDIPATNKLAIYGDTKSAGTWTDESGNGHDATNAGGVIFEEAPTITTTVEVEWIDSISAAATGNKIYRDDVEIADIANGVQFYSDATAETGTTYKYEVQAYSATEETTQEVTGVNVQTITTAS